MERHRIDICSSGVLRGTELCNVCVHFAVHRCRWLACCAIRSPNKFKWMNGMPQCWMWTEKAVVCATTSKQFSLCQKAWINIGKKCGLALSMGIFVSNRLAQQQLRAFGSAGRAVFKCFPFFVGGIQCIQRMKKLICLYWIRHLFRINMVMFQEHFKWFFLTFSPALEFSPDQYWLVNLSRIQWRQFWKRFSGCFQWLLFVDQLEKHDWCLKAPLAVDVWLKGAVSNWRLE